MPTAPGSEAVFNRSSTARCPRAVRQCIARVPLPTAPGQWGRALQEFHGPWPQGSEAVYCRSSTANSLQAVWQCVARDPLPTALCPQLQCSRAHTVQCSAVHSSKLCGTTQKALMVQRGTHGAVGLQDRV